MKNRKKILAGILSLALLSFGIPMYVSAGAVLGEEGQSRETAEDDSENVKVYGQKSEADEETVVQAGEGDAGTQEYYAAEGITASGTCGEQAAWTLYDSGLLVISGSGPMADFSFIEDNRPWLNYISSITSVQIETGITSIGDGAFRGCIALTSVTIPEGVTVIGTTAFGFCSNLSEVNISEGVTTIGDSAFCDCGVKTIKIPDSVTYIGDNAFVECFNLEMITIPGSVTNIGYCAFCGCSSLRSAVLMEGVNRVGNLAFCGCELLTEIYLPKSLSSVGAFAFDWDRIENIYYAGSKEEWNKVMLCDGGIEPDQLPSNVTVHYNSTTPADYIPGDVNGDEAVDIRDLRIVLKGICGKMEFTSEQKKAADVTGEGKVDVSDLRRLLLYVCGRVETEEL